MAPRKLSESDLRSIVELYRQPGQTISTLAEQYGVSNSAIRRILKNSLPVEEFAALISQKRIGGGVDKVLHHLHYYACSNESYTLDLGEGVPLTMMLIPSGEFMMGAVDDDADAEDSERPQHQVQLTQFLLGLNASDPVAVASGFRV